jgi:DNA-binding CsgD family transcriptional regulator
MDMQLGFIQSGTKSDKAYLFSSTLGPSIRRGNSIEDITSIATAMRVSFVVTLDGLVVLNNDHDGHVANRVHIENGRLWSFNPIVAQSIKLALTALQNGQIQILRDHQTKSLISLRKIVINDEPLVFVRLADRAKPTDSEISMVGKLYGLTRSECAVVQQLYQGHSPENASHNLSIAIATVRTHVKNILKKTESSDIRRLLLNVSQALG